MLGEGGGACLLGRCLEVQMLEYLRSTAQCTGSIVVWLSVSHNCTELYRSTLACLPHGAPSAAHAPPS
jgi:hypothetical protein